MPVFAIVAYNNEATIRSAIVEQYGANFYEFTPSTWLVADSGTSKYVADRIGITDGQRGAQGAVFRFEGYSGWGPRPAWEWLARFPEIASNG